MIHKLAHILILCGLWAVCHGFYLPGMVPTDYEENDKVPLLVNSLTTSYPSGLSYDYYFPLFSFCKPDGGYKKQGESLGAILFGDRIFSSPFELYMLKDEDCKYLCTAKYPLEKVSFLYDKIVEMYKFNWLIDGLPAAEDSSQYVHSSVYQAGIYLGRVVSESQVELHNHFDIKVDYHKTRLGQYRVVGVLVEPSSRNIQRPEDSASPQCESSQEMRIKRDEPTEVTYTYSVKWIESKTVWATRWDKFLQNGYTKIHWFSLINSSIVVLLLVGSVFAVLLRALRKDIAKYNEVDLSEDIQEDSGWKLVHGDVFRSPKNAMLFSIFLGSGAQLFTMFGVTLIFAVLGFLSPSNRGALATVMILLYAFFGVIGGYISSNAYKTFGGEAWKLNLILTPLVVPAIIFGVFFVLNFFLVFAHSSGAVPFGTMIVIVLLWFAVSVPLSVFGGFLGFKREAVAAPVRTNQIPRQIPVQPMYLRKVPSILEAGIFPFMVIFVEFYFILNSFWAHLFYYMFGFLFICFILMIVASASVSILLTYFQLCKENYHWQWQSFFFSGASAFYVFGYSIFYLAFKLSMTGFTSVMLYIGYSLLLSFITFITTGTIGFVCTYLFVKTIYGSIKID